MTLTRVDLVADPTGTPLGPCQLQASPFCTGAAVQERLDPMAMAPENPAPANVIPCCTTCFEARSDLFLASAR